MLSVWRWRSGERESAGSHERDWVDGDTVLLHFEVEVTSEGVAGVAFAAERCACGHLCAWGNAKRTPLHVAVQCDGAVAVIDADGVQP